MTIKKRKRDKSINFKIIILIFLVKIQQILKDIINRFKPSMEDFWDSHYITGVWDDLREIEQVPLYSILTGYFKFLKKGGSILDVGCGEGVFLERLENNSYSKYIGFDISQEAISRALKKHNENTIFLKKDIFDFETDEVFDAIVFSEILYYIDIEKIPELMRKYENYLKTNGIFIISMVNNRNTEVIRNIIKNFFPLIDKTEINNKSGHSWICEVYYSSKKQIE